MSNKYWINSGIIKAAGPSSLGTYTGFDDIVCDILKCKFGMDCCTGEDETPGACCVQFNAGAGAPDCSKFTGTYYISNSGEVYICNRGVPTILGTFLYHIEGADVEYDLSDDTLIISREGTTGNTYLTMNDTGVTNVALTYIDTANPLEITVVAAGDAAAQISATDGMQTASVTVTAPGTARINSTTGQVIVTTLINAVDDAAAAGAGVLLNGLYHNAGALRIRIV
jgi:hypothetical protein